MHLSVTVELDKFVIIPEKNNLFHLCHVVSQIDGFLSIFFLTIARCDRDEVIGFCAEKWSQNGKIC